MRRWIKKHRRFLLASSACWVVLLLFFIAFMLFGKELLGGAAEAGRLEETDRKVKAFMTIAAILQFYAAVVYAMARLRLKVWVAVPLLVLIHLGFERWVSPRLMVPLKLRVFLQIRDVDHRPTRTDRRQGWNSDSIRCAWERKDFRSEGLNIIFLGDSFTVGMHLETDQAFPNRVERMLGSRFPDQDVKVANFAWPSSCPLLSYRRLVELGPFYHPDLIVYCLDMTDFHDDILYQNMLDRRGIYWFYDKIPLTLMALKTLAPPLFTVLYRWSNDNLPPTRYFMTDRPLEEIRHYFEPLLENLDKIRRFSEDQGARFVLIILPRAYQYSDRESPESWEKDLYTPLGPYVTEPFRFFEAYREEAGYPIYSLLETFRATEVFPTCFSNDPHWNPAGAAIAAKAIAGFLEEEVERRRESEKGGG